MPSGDEGVMACVDRCLGAGNGTASKGGESFDVDLEATVARAEAALFTDALILIMRGGANGKKATLSGVQLLVMSLAPQH